MIEVTEIEEFAGRRNIRFFSATLPPPRSGRYGRATAGEGLQSQ